MQNHSLHIAHVAFDVKLWDSFALLFVLLLRHSGTILFSLHFGNGSFVDQQSQIGKGLSIIMIVFLDHLKSTTDEA